MRQTKRFAVVGSDARQAAAGRALARAGYTVGGVQQLPQADCILLPLPLEQADLPLAQLLGMAKPGALALGGKVTDSARTIARAAGVELVDYFARPELTVYNAIPTAEGCIGILLERRSRTLWGAAVLVLGFGPVGQALGARLAALGVNVTVCARRAEQRALAESLGLRGAELARLAALAPAFDTVVNTIPAPVLTAAVLAFAFLFSVVHIGIGKFGQWYTDSDLVKQDTNALLLKNDLPEGDYRIDTYKIHDNIGMWLDKSCLQYFGSTAAPSILSFYPALGVKRDVRSEPELSNYALRGLLSVEYLITTPEKQTDFENEADDGWEYAFAKDGYAVYRNTNYVPMGFAYDYYLTQTEYEETAKATRANLLMRALVLTDEDAAVYGKYLTHLPEGRREELYYESYVQDCRERRATAASVFQMNNSGFHAEITLEKENLVFFSVPYDDGFTAYVNGQEADIVEVDEGLMAVLCPAGENSIDFVYQPDGIRLSRALTLGGIVVWLAYTAYFVWRKRRTKRA